MPVGKSHSIRFEINVERKIAALAAVAGISPGEMIREIVNDRVNDTDSERIRHRLHQLESQVTAMRQDFAIAIEALRPPPSHRLSIIVFTSLHVECS